jgi:hypothetical protein
MISINDPAHDSSERRLARRRETRNYEAYDPIWKSHYVVFITSNSIRNVSPVWYLIGSDPIGQPKYLLQFAGADSRLNEKVHSSHSVPFLQPYVLIGALDIGNIIIDIISSRSKQIYFRPNIIRGK